MDLNKLFVDLGGVVALAAVVAYLGKTFIESLVTKNIEVFKSEVESKAQQHTMAMESLYAKSIEEFKHALQREAYKHEVVFVKLHEKVMEVVAELYQRLAKTHRMTGSYISSFVPAGAKSEADRQADAYKAYTSCEHFYQERAIYFDDEVCEKIDAFLKENKTIIIEFNDRKLSDSPTRTWVEVTKNFEANFKTLKQDLEKEFRKKVGVLSE